MQQFEEDLLLLIGSGQYYMYNAKSRSVSIVENVRAENYSIAYLVNYKKYIVYRDTILNAEEYR
jgi:hypothetical protein